MPLAGWFKRQLLGLTNGHFTTGHGDGQCLHFMPSGGKIIILRDRGPAGGLGILLIRGAILTAGGIWKLPQTDTSMNYQWGIAIQYWCHRSLTLGTGAANTATIVDFFGTGLSYARLDLPLNARLVTILTGSLPSMNELD